MESHPGTSSIRSLTLLTSPCDWLDEGHLAYFVLDIISELDLGPITRAIDTKDARGEKPYSPHMMVALLLYAYCVGVFSSRRCDAVNGRPTKTRRFV